MESLYDIGVLLTRGFRNEAFGSDELSGGSYMSTHVLLNSLKGLGERDKNARLAEHFISFSQ